MNDMRLVLPLICRGVIRAAESSWAADGLRTAPAASVAAPARMSRRETAAREIWLGKSVGMRVLGDWRGVGSREAGSRGILQAEDAAAGDGWFFMIRMSVHRTMVA